jgi:hypothetical protein
MLALMTLKIRTMLPEKADVIELNIVGVNRRGRAHIMRP